MSFFPETIESAGNKVGIPSSFPFMLPYPRLTMNLERVEFTENDLEGHLFVVKRDGGYGKLEAVFAQAHGYLMTYLTPDGVEKFKPLKERVRPFTIEAVSDSEAMKSMGDNTKRIITTAEAQGHGAGCYPDWGAPSPGNLFYPYAVDKRHTNWNLFEALIEMPSGGYHIRYIPSRTVAEEPKWAEVEEKGYTYCKYKLINMFDPKDGMWANRHQAKVFDPNDNYGFIGHGGPGWNNRGDKEGLQPSEEWKALREKAFQKVTAVIFKAFSLLSELKLPKPEPGPSLSVNFQGTMYSRPMASISGSIDIASDIAKAGITFLIDWIEKKIQEIKDKLAELIPGYDKIKAGLTTAKEKSKDWADKIAAKITKLGDKISEINAVNSTISGLKSALNSIENELANLRNKLKNTAKTIASKVKKLFKWIVKHIANPAWDKLNDAVGNKEKQKQSVTNQKASAERQLNYLTTEKVILENEIAEMNRQKAICDNEVSRMNSSILSLDNTISDLKSSLSFLISFKDDAGSCIQNNKILDFLGNVSWSGFKRSLDQLIDILNGDALFEKFDKYYPTMNLSPELKYFVAKDHHPWSHNPAHLAWVYLPTKDGSERTYFSDTYVDNQYMEDLLTSNFIYVNNKAVPK